MFSESREELFTHLYVQPLNVKQLPAGGALTQHVNINSINNLC